MAGTESKGSRRYDKENLWQSTVAIKSDPVGHGGDYETAAHAVVANGHNKVWECYVAGICPTNETSKFTAKIELKDGVPIVTWDPNLNTNGVVRAYKVYGSATPENGGDWQFPTNSLHRFFKVNVEMP